MNIFANIVLKLVGKRGCIPKANEAAPSDG